MWSISVKVQNYCEGPTPTYSALSQRRTQASLLGESWPRCPRSWRQDRLPRGAETDRLGYRHCSQRPVTAEWGWNRNIQTGKHGVPLVSADVKAQWSPHTESCRNQRASGASPQKARPEHESTGLPRGCDEQVAFAHSEHGQNGDVRREIQHKHGR